MELVGAKTGAEHVIAHKHLKRESSPAYILPFPSVAVSHVATVEAAEIFFSKRTVGVARWKRLFRTFSNCLHDPFLNWFDNVEKGAFSWVDWYALVWTSHHIFPGYS